MMKNLITLVLFVTVLPLYIQSQPPQAFKYQAVVRDNAGEILQNQAIGIRISIHDITAGGTIVYQETFFEATNEFGLVNLQIGNGTPGIGIFTEIDWGSNSKFLEIEIDPAGGSAYVSMGTSELLSVPYAIYSGLSARTSLVSNIGSGNIFVGDSVAPNNTGSSNAYVGYQSGHNNTSGYVNSFLGYQSGYSNTSGSGNIFIGNTSGYNNTTGGLNTFIGDRSGNSNTEGSRNIYLGYKSGFINSTGNYNVGLGYKSLYYNTGSENTATGYASLYKNSTGYSNTANGFGALYSNTIGIENTATGHYALYSNTEGGINTANGQYALYSNTSGWANTALGYYTLRLNTTGIRNTACGNYALNANSTGDANTAIGYWSLSQNYFGDYNTAIGDHAYSTGTNYSNSTAVGFSASVGASNKVIFGNNSVNWIGGNSPWYNTSDARVKNNIREDVKGLDFILELRPVTYYFDKDKMDELTGVVDSSDYPEKYDVEKIKQSGFLAQEVEQAAIEAGYDFNGVCKPKGDVKYYSLAYAEFVVPLVKGMQEQQAMIEKQQVLIEELQSQVERLIQIQK